MKVSVFDYTDYRKYLQDHYTAEKKRNKAFSYRYFARRAGINSVGLYKDVIEGRQNLGRSLILKFAQSIGLGKKETEYFENMVYFNEAKSVDERKLFFERMMASYRSKARKVDSSKYEFYSKWYYSAIRALISLYKIRDDNEFHRKVAKILVPTIRPEQVKKSLQILKKLDFICENDEGFFELVDAVITTGEVKTEKNVMALNVVNFQKEMMKLAGESFDRHKTNQLDMSTLTLSISGETLKEIKRELAVCRQKIAGMAERDKNPEFVYQLNQHLYPMSKKIKEENND